MQENIKNNYGTLVLNLHDVGCKNRCVFCGNHGRYLSKKVADNIAANELKKLEVLDKTKIDLIIISGNDPIEYYDFIGFLKKIKKITKIPIFLQSHCVDFCDMKFLKEVLNVGNVKKIQIPIYGHNAIVHDAITKNKGSFKSIMLAIKNLKILNFKDIQLNTLFLKQNEQHINKVIPFLLAFGHPVNASLVCLPSYRNLYNKKVINNAPDLETVFKFFKEKIKGIKGKTEKLFLHDMPYCLVSGFDNVNFKSDFSYKGYEHFRNKNIDYIETNKGVLASYRILVKSKKCDDCYLNYKCKGITKPYVDLKLFKFKPFKMDKIIKREHYQDSVGRSPFIYAGYVCNNNCIFCFEKDLDFFNKGTNNLKEEIKVIRKRFDFINFMGQEPTLREDIFDLIKYAKKLKFKQIGITTNGRMFSYLDFTKKIIESGLNQVVLTVTGHTKKIHEFHTLSEGSFSQTLSGVKNIISQNRKDLSLVLNIMVTKKNYKLLPDMIKYYFNLGIKEMNIGHILPFNKLINKSKDIVAKMKDVVPYLIEIQERYGGKIKFLFVEYPPCVFPKEYRHLSFPCMEESPQKIYFALCKNCQFRKQCDGVHKYYIDLYGEKEFKLNN